jgi:hypothetical protein
MESAIEPRESESGAELAALSARRVLRSAILANGLGGLAVFTFGLLAPGSPDREDGLRLALANAGTFVFFMVIAFTIGARWGRNAAEPLNRWLQAGRAATPAEQDLALSYPAHLTKMSAKIWVAAAAVFTAVNMTYSVSK